MSTFEKSLQAARAGVERSRRISQATAPEDPVSHDEVRELRLAVDQLAYAVDLLAHEQGLLNK